MSELLSNVCRHRQSLMLKGRGKAQNIICPFHRWTNDTQGQLLGAPHFPANPCLHLDKTALKEWNGLLFADPRDVAGDLAGMHHGRRALFEQGLSQEGPYQSLMEDGMVHFHEWLRRRIGPHL